MSEITDKVLEIGKKRGIFWPSYEIYGGIAGLYDIGPVGVRIKNKIVSLWRKLFVEQNSDLVYEIETPLITPKPVLEASGHLENFTDPVVECSKCHKAFRADHLVEEKLRIKSEGLLPSELTKIIQENHLTCPLCGGDLGEVRSFNLLFNTTIGPFGGIPGFLRPETAQGMFTSFKRVYDSMRQRMPMGIAQVGRVGRNEISPRQGLLRLREFTIMEVEFFIDPSESPNPPWDRLPETKLNILTAEAKARGEARRISVYPSEAFKEGIIKHEWMAYWMATAETFAKRIGIRDTYFEEKLPEERAHYSKQTFDQMAVIGEEKIEISGHAYRGDYDLSRHMKYSGEDLTVFKKYDEPKIVEREFPLVDRRKLATLPGGKTVLEKISSIQPEKLVEMVRSNQVIEGVELAQVVSIEKRREKVTGERYVPNVIEPSFGVERTVYVTILNGIREKEGRNILSLPPEIAPWTVGVYPLLERKELITKAEEVYEMLSKRFDCVFDESGGIGKRYARNDEIGIPYGVTIDPSTLEDNSVTIRERDSWIQVRVFINELTDSIERLLRGDPIETIGKKVM